MLSLCKKEIQFQNLLKKIVNSEHEIYLLIQIVKFSNSDKKVKWPQAATAASNVYGSLDLLFNISTLVKPLIRFMRPSPNWSLGSFFLETFHSHSILLYLCYLCCPEFTFISNQNIPILYDTCCGSKVSWYWTSARGLWDSEVIKNKMNFA